MTRRLGASWHSRDLISASDKGSRASLSEDSTWIQITMNHILLAVEPCHLETFIGWCKWYIQVIKVKT